MKVGVLRFFCSHFQCQTRSGRISHKIAQWKQFWLDSVWQSYVTETWRAVTPVDLIGRTGRNNTLAWWQVLVPNDLGIYVIFGNDSTANIPHCHKNSSLLHARGSAVSYQKFKRQQAPRNTRRQRQQARRPTSLQRPARKSAEPLKTEASLIILMDPRI